MLARLSTLVVMVIVGSFAAFIAGIALTILWLFLSLIWAML